MAAKNLGASGILYTDRRDFYISPQVTKELWTDATPYTTIVSNRSITTGLKDPIFKMFEHRSTWRKQQFAIASGDGTIPNSNDGLGSITVTDVTGLNATADSSWVGLQVEVWDSTEATKKGVALITAVASAELTLKSLKAATITLVTGDICKVIGNAFGEGSEAADAWADELETVWGSTQIFKTAVEITGTLYEAALRGYSDELARLRKEKSIEHKIQKERAFLFGHSLNGTNLGNDTSSFGDAGRTLDGKTVRTTQGIVSALEEYGDSEVASEEQNVFSLAMATYKYENFVDDMEKVFFFQPEVGAKYALAGPGAMGYWSKMDGEKFFAGKSKWTVNLSEERRDGLGFNFKYLETPHGILKLVRTPAFMGNRNYNMLVISDENLSLMQYRAPKFQANIKTDNAYDGVKDQYFSDEGVGISLLESHKLFKLV